MTGSSAEWSSAQHNVRSFVLWKKQMGWKSSKAVNPIAYFEYTILILRPLYYSFTGSMKSNQNFVLPNSFLLVKSYEGQL